MGIPSYFSYIVKNHRNILKKYNNSFKINNIYLDCNSIIYDCVHSIEYKNNNVEFERKLLKEVCNKINSYIETIKPDKKVLIAFDGVAPVAKLEQQRNRRYKSWFQKEIIEEIYNDRKKSWDTTAITPGTNFMSNLVSNVEKYFEETSKFNVDEIIIYASDVPGEGEHKIFDYIRKNENYHKNTSTAIYGLDADLIMLTLNHLHITNNLYLFRETPHFIKNVDSTLNPDENYVLDIPEFSNVLESVMVKNKKSKSINKKNLILDYVLMCFFLGNDFLPHFPALNIRTNGIDYMMEAYSETLGTTNEYLTDDDNVVWKNLRKIISWLSEKEKTYILHEYKMRKKYEKKFYPIETPEQEEYKFMMIPTYERNVEKYINPNEDGWEERYYKQLFDVDITEERKKQICINYLEGLEWTINYYTTGCIDWRWKYNYNYPPLLTDLIKYTPYFDTKLIQENDNKPVSDLVQLSYVLPRNSLKLLPVSIKNKLLKDFSENYSLNFKFEWCFCKYFWESHVIMPEIDINNLESIVTS